MITGPGCIPWARSPRPDSMGMTAYRGPGRAVLGLEYKHSDCQLMRAPLTPEPVVRARRKFSSRAVVTLRRAGGKRGCGTDAPSSLTMTAPTAGAHPAAPSPRPVPPRPAPGEHLSHPRVPTAAADRRNVLESITWRIGDPHPISVPTAVSAFMRRSVSGEPSPSRFIHAVTVKADRQVNRRASRPARSESY